MKVSFVGCGKVAHFHLQALRQLGIEVISVCGRQDSENAKFFAKQYDIPRVYSSWSDLLSNEKPDAFWIVAHWQQIHNLLVPFIETGIPCFFEKPVALTPRKIEEAIRVRDRHKTKVLVGYNRRFYDFIAEVKDFISGHEVLAAQVNIPELIRKYILDNELEIIKNLWIYNSAHVLDLLYYLVGDLEIKALYKKNDAGLGLPVSFNGIMRATKRNFPIHLIANWGTAGNFEIIFYCKGHMVKLSPLEKMSIYSGVQVSEPTAQCPIRVFSPILQKESYVDTHFKPGFLRQAQNFIDTCIMGKSENTQAATLEDALKITTLCQKIQNG